MNTSPNFDLIPADLKAIQRWVGWRFNRKPDGSLGKVPQGVNGNASAHDPKNWMTFNDAVAFVQERLASGRWPEGGGIGFAFTDDDDIGGVDLDGCRDPATGQIASWANRVLRLFDGAYVEVSPSGAGFHIITRGAPAKLAKTTRPVPPEVLKDDLVIEGKDALLEAFVTKRFFTITGDHATGRLELRDCSAAWEQVAAYLRGDQPREEREQVARAAGQDFQPLGDEDLDAVRSALSVLSTDELGRNLWIMFGRAIKAEFGEAGKPVWLEWMAQSPNDDAAASENMWDGNDFTPPELMTIGSIFWHAQQKGWKPPRKKSGGLADTSAAVLAGILDRVELWHDRRAVAYATVSVTRRDGSEHRENLRVDGSEFEDWLTREFYLATGTTPKREKLREIVGLAKARGVFEGEQHPTWVRTATGENSKLYIDLGDEDWQAVEVDAEGWRIVSDPPVKFRRSGGMLPLPLPVPGDAEQALAQLESLIGAQEPAHFMLIVGWLLAALRAGYPIAALVFDCEPGSGKTTKQRMIRSFIDPQVSATPGPNTNERDLIISAHSRWLVSADNVTEISQAMSDAYCRLITGGGMSNRKLFKDEDEHSVDIKRPLCLALIGTELQSDMAERSIVIPLAPLTEGLYLPEAELDQRLRAIQPAIMAALLDGLVMAMRRVADVTERLAGRLPRMSDFAVWGEAAGPAFGWEEDAFFDAYTAHVAARREEDAEDDMLCSKVFDWLCGVPGGAVEGPARDLREQLHSYAVQSGSWDWLPRKTKTFTSRLTRSARRLRSLGVSYTTHRGRVHRLALTDIGKERRPARLEELRKLRGWDDE